MPGFSSLLRAPCRTTLDPDEPRDGIRRRMHEGVLIEFPGQISGRLAIEARDEIALFGGPFAFRITAPSRPDRDFKPGEPLVQAGLRHGVPRRALRHALRVPRGQ